MHAESSLHQHALSKCVHGLRQAFCTTCSLRTDVQTTCRITFPFRVHLPSTRTRVRACAHERARTNKSEERTHGAQLVQILLQREQSCRVVTLIANTIELIQRYLVPHTRARAHVHRWCIVLLSCREGCKDAKGAYQMNIAAMFTEQKT